jgi:hypothetical protein
MIAAVLEHILSVPFHSPPSIQDGADKHGRCFFQTVLLFLFGGKPVHLLGTPEFPATVEQWSSHVVLVRLRRRVILPPLSSILLANIQSLVNKLNELRARISF